MTHSCPELRYRLEQLFLGYQSSAGLQHLDRQLRRHVAPVRRIPPAEWCRGFNASGFGLCVARDYLWWNLAVADVGA